VGVKTGTVSTLVCLSKVCNGLNSVSVLSPEFCLLTAEDTPGVLVMASCMYFFGTQLNDLLCFTKVTMYVYVTFF